MTGEYIPEITIFMFDFLGDVIGRKIQRRAGYIRGAVGLSAWQTFENMALRPQNLPLGVIIVVELNKFSKGDGEEKKDGKGKNWKVFPNSKPKLRMKHLSSI